MAHFTSCLRWTYSFQLIFITRERNSEAFWVFKLSTCWKRLGQISLSKSKDANYEASCWYSWKQKSECKSLNRVWLFATPWTIQYMEFSRPVYWSGCLSLFQGTFPSQELNLGLPQCRRILYQLSYQAIPESRKSCWKTHYLCLRICWGPLSSLIFLVKKLVFII